MTTTANIPSRLAAVWFADIVGYSRLASHDERSALDLVDVLRAVVTRVVGEHGGRLVKLMGDGASWRWAYVYASLGEKDRAFESLERAYAERRRLFELVRGPRLDPLRDDPRFDPFLKGMNLSP